MDGRDDGIQGFPFFAYHAIPIWHLVAYVNQATALVANNGHLSHISVNRMASELYRNEREYSGGEV